MRSTIDPFLIFGRQQQNEPIKNDNHRVNQQRWFILSSCVLLWVAGVTAFGPPSDQMTFCSNPRLPLFLARQRQQQLLSKRQEIRTTPSLAWISSLSSSSFVSQPRYTHRHTLSTMTSSTAALPFVRGHLLDAMDDESNRRWASTLAEKNGDKIDHSHNCPPPPLPEYTEYETWVRRLYMTNLFHPAKLDLRNMERLYDLIGRPLDQPNVSVIHVAGTNGKGSVCLKIARTLELLDPSHRVGLFCSPHIASFRERMQVNGELISEAEVVELLPHIYQLCEDHDIPATFFEITTALAFQFYSRRNVQFVVLEAGLGGRLDATNVIANPSLSIVTSIGLEHTKILGDTIEKIALEKGGIIKAGRPVLVGPKSPHDVLRQCATEKGASSYSTCDSVLDDLGSVAAVTTDYDVENSRIAKAAILLLQEMKVIDSVSSEVMDQGTSQRPPCRFEHIQRNEEGGPRIILDVAHNPPAMEYLIQKLHTTYPQSKFRVVIGMSCDKDLAHNAQLVLQLVRNDPTAIHLVEAAHPRAAKLEDMFHAAPPLLSSHYNRDDPSVERQVQDAIAMARHDDDGIVVVCGSIFLMAAAREALGLDEPRDSPYIAQVAGSGFRHGQENFGNTKQ